MLPIVREGLVLELHFNEISGSTVYDLSGYGNNGIIYGATRVNEGFGRALRLDGVDDYVEVLDAPSLDGMTELTILGWVQPFTLPAGSYKPIVAKWISISDYSYWFGMFGKAFHIQVFNAWARTGEVLSTGEWQHLSFTWKAREIPKLYINGVEQSITYFGEWNTITSVRDTTAPLTVGKYMTLYYSGLVDEVLIFNRALSEEEIRALYNYYIKKKEFER